MLCAWLRVDRAGESADGSDPLPTLSAPSTCTIPTPLVEFSGVEISELSSELCDTSVLPELLDAEAETDWSEGDDTPDCIEPSETGGG